MPNDSITNSSNDNTNPAAFAVPIIDFSTFLDPEASASQRKQVADDAYIAFRDVGFVDLVNHGFLLDLIGDAFGWVSITGATAVSAKKKPHRWSSTPPRSASSERPAALDVKESFECGRQDDMLTPNHWPDPAALPGFANFCMRYYWTMRETQVHILHAVALDMGLGDKRFFDPLHTHAQNQLRLLHYPSVDETALHAGEKERIAAHSDFGTLTILVQDACGGLEVQDPRSPPGTFVPAPPVGGAIIVNIGDFFMRWSNDDLKSTLHRVRAPPAPVMKEDGEHDEKAMVGKKLTASRYSIP
ncbi:MAG: hypothetical protein M1819_003383 [Sarea resinae]|nr:MAG: hypothetical protein M1819_003383 [Sarea resinae]